VPIGVYYLKVKLVDRRSLYIAEVYLNSGRIHNCVFLKMNANGQTLNDRLLAARHSLAGQGLAKAVCKATTEELISPKKKHLDCKQISKHYCFPLYLLDHKSRKSAGIYGGRSRTEAFSRTQNEYLSHVCFADLLHCTEEPNVSIPTLANLLLERTQNTNWIVVFKSLVSLHHLMCYGNEVKIYFIYRVAFLRSAIPKTFYFK